MILSSLIGDVTSRHTSDIPSVGTLNRHRDLGTKFRVWNHVHEWAFWLTTALHVQVPGENQLRLSKLATLVVGQTNVDSVGRKPLFLTQRVSPNQVSSFLVV